MRLKTVALWVALLGLLAGFYAAFSSEGLSRPNRHEVFVAWWPVAVVTLFVVLTFMLVRRSRAVAGLSAQGQTLLAEGRLADAMAVFERATAKSRDALPLYDLGLTQLLLWRVRDAIRTLEEFERRAPGLLHGVPGGAELAAPPLALACAMVGEIEPARHWLKQESTAAIARLAEVTVACRQGDFAGAGALLRQHEVVLDQEGGTLRALSHALAAWVASRLGGESGSVSLAALFRESNLDLVREVWPELHTFLERSAGSNSA